MRFLQPGKSLARLVDLAVLRQAGAVNAMTRGKCRTLLQSFAAIFDRFGKASGEIMGNGETRIENRILRVVRAHPDRLLQMRDRLFGLAAKCERPPEIAVRSGEVRVEVECTLEFRRCRAGPPPHECHVAQREVRPRIAMVQFLRPGGKTGGLL